MCVPVLARSVENAAHVPAPLVEAVQLLVAASNPSLKRNAGVPVGHSGGARTAPAHGSCVFIWTASSALLTCVQSDAVMPAVPMRSVQDWVSAVKSSREAGPDGRETGRGRYSILAALVRPMAGVGWLF